MGVVQRNQQAAEQRIHGVLQAPYSEVIKPNPLYRAPGIQHWKLNWRVKIPFEYPLHFEVSVLIFNLCGDFFNSE